MLLVPMTARANFCSRKLSSFVHFEDEMNPSESGPDCALISEKRRATSERASSQVAERNCPFSRIKGVVKRSGLLICPQLNFPLIQVEMPLAGPCSGTIFRMCRSLVQTSKLQPTPQYVQTVFVLRTRCWRIADS